MQLKQTDLADRIGKALTDVRPWSVSVRTIALLACVATLPKPAEAASVDIFLIATHNAPAPSATAPFSLETTKVYQLGDINGGFGATRATLVNNFTFDVDTALTYSSLDNPDASKPTDPGETGAGTATYIDSEVSTWDNVNIPNSGAYDPTEQLDFGRNASITFNPVAGGFTDLVLAELGGFNPFSLGLCGDAACNNYSPVFNGINSGLRNSLLGSGNFPEFAVNDSTDDSEMDQTWLFRFSDPIYDYVRILEFDTRSFYTNARLQLDFVGAGGTMPSAVPVPTGLPLLASGLGLLIWSQRRRKA